jgi:ribosomal protein S18 acetylase RimI-like enzyme
MQLLIEGHINDFRIKKEKYEQWRDRFPKLLTFFQRAYAEAIPSIKNAQASQANNLKRQAFDNLFLNNHHYCNVGFETKPMGFIAYKQNPLFPQCVIISVWYIVPELRKKGYGKLLMNEFIKCMPSQRVIEADIGERRSNWLIEFYKRLGFITLGQTNEASMKLVLGTK